MNKGVPSAAGGGSDGASQAHNSDKLGMIARQLGQWRDAWRQAVCLASGEPLPQAQRWPLHCSSAAMYDHPISRCAHLRQICSRSSPSLMCSELAARGQPVSLPVKPQASRHFTRSNGTLRSR